MDRREAIKAFIKQNSRLFGLSPFPAEVFKRKKFEFFTEYAKVAIPKDKEIAGEILEGMIDASQIQTEEGLGKIIAYPFFRENIQNKEYYYEKLLLKARPGQPLLDMKKLGEAEYKNKVIEDLQRQAEEKILQEGTEKIQRMKEELERMKEESHSILFSKEYPLPDEVETAEVADETVRPHWWEELGLLGNPLQINHEGLEGIDPMLYDQVVYKTGIFLKYESTIKTAPEEVFKNQLVFGPFGSGKTTFFEYIRPKLYDRKVYSFQISLVPEFDLPYVLGEFQRLFYQEVSKTFRMIGSTGTSDFDAVNKDDAIIRMLTELMNRHGVRGFVVFIDDLHKGNLDIASNFLSHLQALSTGFRRQLPNRSLGFFISASNEWERKIANNPKYSGSISQPERMPEIDAEIVHRALNQRLKAFAKNPENPKQFDQRFVERICSAVRQKQGYMTFRDVLRETLDNFQKGHFDILSVNPINIPSSTLEEIKDALEKDYFAMKQLNRLVYGQKNLKPGQKRLCFVKLAEIYATGGLRESDIREADVPFLQRLLGAGLIFEELRGDKGVWRISEELQRRADFVKSKYGLNFDDYLVKIYGGQSEKRLGPRNETVESIETFLARLNRDKIYESLSLAKSLYEEVVVKPQDIQHDRNVAKIVVEKCADSLSSLTRAYLFFEQISLPEDTHGHVVLHFWDDFWWSPEIMQQCLRLIESDEDVLVRAPIFRSLYGEAFPQLFEFFRRQYEQSRRIRIPLLHLNNEEIKLFNDCRDWIVEARYFEIAEKLSKYLEGKLRTFLLDFLTIVYGDREQRLSRLDQESRRYITQELARDESQHMAPTKNEMTLLNRKQYKNIMTGISGSPEGRRNWNSVFAATFQGWSETDLYNYLNLFGDVNIIASHNKDSLGIEQERLVQKFIQDSIDFVIRINRTYQRILSKEVFRRESTSTARFSFCNFKDGEASALVQVQASDISRFVDRFIDGREFIINLNDQERIRSYFDMNYRSLCAIASILANRTEADSDIRARLVVISTRGPEVKSKLLVATEQPGAG